ncbi:MAG: UDP-N-acetylglucosamine 1-carboxyvinyltransferase [Patescibacteria group bacterium]
MKFIIHGGKKLHGTLFVAGMKNAATPIIAATLLTDEVCTLSNIPRISDVEVMLSILKSMGSEVAWTNDHEVTICNKNARIEAVDEKTMKRLRSSSLFMGPFLARFEKASIAEPGGCIIGNRPLGTHFHALEKLGATIERTNGHYELSRTELIGSRIVLLEASVTATENVLMAACAAIGETTIVNAAYEPHVQDLAWFLVAMGAQIEGIGTSTLRIQGGRLLSGATHAIIPDTIEAGTFLMLGIATKSELTIQHARSEHMDVVLEWLKTIGAHFDIFEDSITLRVSSSLKAAHFEFYAYPRLPSDLQAIFGVLATQLHGTTLIHEKMFEGRLGYISELVKMGANAVICDPHRVLITGPTPLYGQEIRSFDLRAGAAMIIAGLIASGETIIYDAEIIDRGYECIEERLSQVGADIQRIE